VRNSCVDFALVERTEGNKVVSGESRVPQWEELIYIPHVFVRVAKKGLRGGWVCMSGKQKT